MEPFRIPEGRLFQRIPVEGLVIGWNVRSRRSGWALREATTSELGVVQDLSGWGAKVLAPTDTRLARDAPLIIRADGATGIAKVRWSSPSEDRKMSTYGVEFVVLDPHLEAWLLQPISQRRGDLEIAWAGHDE